MKFYMCFFTLVFGSKSFFRAIGAVMALATFFPLGAAGFTSRMRQVRQAALSQDGYGLSRSSRNMLELSPNQAWTVALLLTQGVHARSAYTSSLS